MVCKRTDQDKEDVVWKTNREKARAPKTGKYWCDTCDANMVGHYERCSVCGKHNGEKRLKKG